MWTGQAEVAFALPLCPGHLVLTRVGDSAPTASRAVQSCLCPQELVEPRHTPAQAVRAPGRHAWPPMVFNEIHQREVAPVLQADAADAQLPARRPLRAGPSASPGSSSPSCFRGFVTRASGRVNLVVPDPGRPFTSRPRTPPWRPSACGPSRRCWPHPCRSPCRARRRPRRASR